MTRNELIKLRNLVDQEKQRRERIKELLVNPLLQEYLNITSTDYKELAQCNITEILNQILSTFTITKTNGIYVCTGAYYVDCDICYQDTSYYTRSADIDSNIAEYRLYTNIENDKRYKAVKDKTIRNWDNNPSFNEFESNNIILNPYNTNVDMNGYNEVKYDFFNTAIKDGQAKAKKLVLSKYPRL